MRLNHVESFYMFLLHFRSECNEERGRQAIARPSARVADHGQALYRGGRPWSGPYRGGHKRPGPPTRAVVEAAPSRGLLARGDACQRSTVGAAPTKAPARPRGVARVQGDRQRRVALSPAQGQQRRQRGGKRGSGNPFKKRMILPL
ncbi:hypothetical protein B296_00031898 [Ensete ventricosum]|uniref:Uncharacterized protein n=1 Tax=Ensete ventricosum TaxID=4639 RepID=A0A426XXB9_ENSVE|nr:hypothetical protein B296_00031898 [Ensete ventricosum]